MISTWPVNKIVLVCEAKLVHLVDRADLRSIRRIVDNFLGGAHRDGHTGISKILLTFLCLSCECKWIILLLSTT